jgi:hypothetical protein
VVFPRCSWITRGHCSYLPPRSIFQGSWEFLRADLIAVYQPVNSQELFAIERIALAQQAMLRIARLESGLLTSCLNEALDTSGQLFIIRFYPSIPRPLSESRYAKFLGRRQPNKAAAGCYN